MKKSGLSLVELATYGYAVDRVKKGSWLEQTFGPENRDEDDGRIGRLNKNKDERKDR